MRALRPVAALLGIISVSICFAADNGIVPDLGAISDRASWTMHHASGEVFQADGRSVARLTAEMDSAKGFVGLAAANGVMLDTGTIDIDLKGMGGEKRCFLGVAFNIADEKTFEGIYFRPFNFHATGESKGHAVQYVAWPEHPWDQLRRDTPGRFEAAIDPPPDPDKWFHARIAIGPTQVRVFVNDAKEPSLTVDRLSKAGEPRPIGLLVDSHEGLYAGLKITPGT